MCLYGKCSSRAGKEAFEADGLAGICAEAVLAFVDAADGCLYFAQKFALAVAGAQFQRVLFFLSGAVGRIGKMI